MGFIEDLRHRMAIEAKARNDAANAEAEAKQTLLRNEGRESRLAAEEKERAARFFEETEFPKFTEELKEIVSNITILHQRLHNGERFLQRFLSAPITLKSQNSRFFFAYRPVGFKDGIQSSWGGFVIEVTPGGEIVGHRSGIISPKSISLTTAQWRGNPGAQERLLGEAYNNPFKVKSVYDDFKPKQEAGQ